MTEVTRTYAPVLSGAVVDTSLDASSIILTTLRDVSKISPIPLLWTAAGIAVDIIEAVQVSRRKAVSLSIRGAQGKRRKLDGIKGDSRSSQRIHASSFTWSSLPIRTTRQMI